MARNKQNRWLVYNLPLCMRDLGVLPVAESRAVDRLSRRLDLPKWLDHHHEPVRHAGHVLRRTHADSAVEYLRLSRDLLRPGTHLRQSSDTGSGHFPVFGLVAEWDAAFHLLPILGERHE